MISLIQTLKNRKQGDGGFTLLEMIIVIVIIGILAAIVIPIGAAQTAKAKETTVASDVKNIADELMKGWNEDEGFPTSFNQKMTDGNTARLYGDGEFILTEGGTTTNPNTGGSTGGTGGNGGTGTTPGNGDGTYKPSTNRQLTWAEFTAANKYDTGIPFAAQGVRNAAGKVGGAMAFDFNYTAGKIGSSAELLKVLQDDCATIYFGYNRFLPDRIDADGQGNNLCSYLREGDSNFTTQEALASLSIFKLTSTSEKEWNADGTGGAYGDNSSVPYEHVVDWAFPTTGTYTIMITKSPTDLVDGCGIGRIDSDGDGTPDRYPRQGESYSFYCQDYAAGYDQGSLETRHLYDVTVFYTATSNAIYSGRPQINGSFMVNDDPGTDGPMYIWSQGGRFCSEFPVGSNTDCGNGHNGQQFSMTDDLPESWWSSYLNGSGGGTGGGNTNPSTDGANGGVRADASNNTYVGSFCVEAHNADIDVWYFYASDQQKVKEGRCPTA